MAYSPIKPLTPTFNINTVQGWTTRQIYNYYGSPAGIYDYYVDRGVYDFDLFAAIADYTFPNTDAQPLYKGNSTLQFSARYFATGKSLRIRGRFLITNQPGAVFNIAIGNFNYGNSTYRRLAITNTGANHEMSAALNDVPVDFEVVVTGIESKYDDPTEHYSLFLQANGYYQYETSSFSSGGANSSPVYVPIWNTNQYEEVGLITTGNSITLDFRTSARVDNLKVMYLTVEELE